MILFLFFWNVSFSLQRIFFLAYLFAFKKKCFCVWARLLIRRVTKYIRNERMAWRVRVSVRGKEYEWKHFGQEIWDKSNPIALHTTWMIRPKILNNVKPLCSGCDGKINEYENKNKFRQQSNRQEKMKAKERNRSQIERGKERVREKQRTTEWQTENSPETLYFMRVDSFSPKRAGLSNQIPKYNLKSYDETWCETCNRNGSHLNTIQQRCNRYWLPFVLMRCFAGTPIFAYNPIQLSVVIVLW